MEQPVRKKVMDLLLQKKALAELKGEKCYHLTRGDICAILTEKEYESVLQKIKELGLEIENGD